MMNGIFFFPYLEEILCTFVDLSLCFNAILAAMVKVLRGPLAGNSSVVAQGLRAVGNMTNKNQDNRKRFATAGACDGTQVTS